MQKGESPAGRQPSGAQNRNSDEQINSTASVPKTLPRTVDLYSDTWDPAPMRTVALVDMLVAICSGAYRQEIQRLRHVLARRGDEAYRKAKGRLEAFTPCGTFTPTRAKANLRQHSGLVHGDLDHLGRDLAAVRQAICGDPHTLFCFVSPGGDGLKFAMPIPQVPDDAAHKRYWSAAAAYYQQQYGLIWDPSAKNIDRLCYVSWDPDLYYAPHARLWETAIPEPAPQPRPQVQPRTDTASDGDHRARYARQALDTATKILDGSSPGNRFHARSKTGYLLGGYIAGGILTETEVLDAIAPVVERNTIHYDRSWKQFQKCLEAGRSDPISFDDLEREREEWLRAHGFSKVPVVDPWLGPRRDWHGVPLAVRRIEA